MQLTELSDEEMGRMEFAGGGKRAGKNPYGDLLKAVKEGKKVLVKLEEGKKIWHLKWGISQAAKRAGMQLDMKVLVDLSGVVVSIPSEEPAAQAETGEAGPQAPTAVGRPRK